jgi:hypothetical protein
MMLVRTITLIFLMILSPLAFVGGVLPSTKKYVGPWWDSLFKNAVYAPVYMALLYVVIYIVIKFPTGTSFIDIFIGEGMNGLGLAAMNFVVINALMIGCIVVATKIGASGASWATAAAGGALFGGSAWAGRKILGGAGSLAIKAGIGKKYGIAGALTRRSFDFRNATGVKSGLSFAGIKAGKAYEGGYTKELEDKIKERTKKIKSWGMNEKELALYSKRSLKAKIPFSTHKATLKKMIGKSKEAMTEKISEIKKDNDYNGKSKALKLANEFVKSKQRALSIARADGDWDTVSEIEDELKRAIDQEHVAQEELDAVKELIASEKANFSEKEGRGFSDEDKEYIKKVVGKKDE